MPRPGGSADKIGNRFEGKWTASRMALLLQHKALAIRLEPPRVEGVEFQLEMPSGIVQHHQVKPEYYNNAECPTRPHS